MDPIGSEMAASAGEGLLVVMGSGETAPTMVKTHRELFERCPGGPAVLLDTPYGFQENADDISARAVAYFATSLRRQIDVVSWRATPPDPLARERALARLREACWAFAGPGSPTYTLRQWRDTPVPSAFAEVVRRGGVAVFASAAALTLGSHTVPVYEIYKAGLTPHWVEGLDLVHRLTGVRAVVIPHFDNAEGGHHDTRYAYLGERRLSLLERQLPEETLILGVDEHTAVVLDLGSRIATVHGHGSLTVRRQGSMVVHPSGATVPFGALGNLAQDQRVVSGQVREGGHGDTRGRRRPGPAARDPIGDRSHLGNAGPGRLDTPAASRSLRAAAADQSVRFDAALSARDVDGAVTAVLALEQAIRDWATDTLTSDEGEIARGALRRMVVRLGELAAVGARDPRVTVEPYVSILLELRSRARDARDFATADWVRERLASVGVEVQDTHTGPVWTSH